MKIQVTQDDIDNGQRWVGSGCPIARACKRAGILGRVTVGLYQLVVGGGEDKHYYMAKLPLEASNFIFGFDNMLWNDRPFEFEIDIPAEFRAVPAVPPETLTIPPAHPYMMAEASEFTLHAPVYSKHVALASA